MKKEYIEPTMDVVEIKRCTLLTQSSMNVHDEQIQNENEFI
jgi:hypothetical protein